MFTFYVPNSYGQTNEIIETGTFTDERDKQTYKWVRLKDGKKWMAQNLNYEISGVICFKKDTSNCLKYGRLYNWEAVNAACPAGWKVPSDDDWWEMSSHYGKASNISPDILSLTVADCSTKAIGYFFAQDLLMHECDMLRVYP